MSKDKIKQLDTRDQCRLKLPIFYGSRDNYYHGFREVCANGIDEIVNNFDSGVLDIILHNDLETITVGDTGRGVPINLETDGVPNYKLLFETLFSGTNFDNNANGKITTGVNGSGTCVLNHTSKLFKVMAVRDGSIYELIYKDGGIFQSFNKLGDSNKHYSEFTFKLDDEVYTKTKYTYEEIYDICHHLAVTNNKIKVILHHEGKEDVEFHYDSLDDYFEENTSGLTSPKIICNERTFDRDNEINKINCIFSSSSEIFQEAYLNSNYLPYGGAINEGIINGIRNYINKYGKDNISKFKNVSKEDIEDSICFLISFESTNVEYENQIKFSTQKKLYKTIMQDYIQEELEIFKLENEKGFNKLLDHIFQIQKFNEKSNANKKALKKKLNEKITITSKIPNLIECKSKDRNETILCICEGQSALGSLMSGRRDIHALYPLRGKILNCFKAPLDKILKNDVVLGVQRSLGCGIEIKSKANKELNTFNIENLRYSKIYIIVDQDFDGIGSILPLLLSMFQTLNPTLIKEGKIFVCETPKYEIICNDKEYYAINDDELNKLLNGELKDKKHTVHYIKGLAELSSEAMALCLSEGYQNITRITLEDVQKSLDMLELFMGKEIAPRREYIFEHFEGGQK